MKKQILFLFLFIIVLAPFAAAGLDPFQLFITPVKDTITVDQIAKFNLTIVNNAEAAEDYNVEIDFSKWNLESNPLYATKTKYGWTVENKSIDSIMIFLKPSADIELYTHKIKIQVASKSGHKASKDALITIRPIGLPYGEYVPTITASVDITNNGVLDPRSPATVFINLDNYVPKKLENLTIEVRSKLINKNIITSLDPLERKTEQFQVVLDRLEKPTDGKDTLTVEVLQDGESLKKVKKEYEVIAYSSFDKDESVKKKLLKSITEIKLTNKGNVNRVQTKKVQTGFLARFFTSTIPEAELIKEDKKLYFVWELNLEPEKSIEIIIVESYRGIALLALVVLAALILYFVFRSPIILQKEAKIMHRGEGGISELKILLYIRNRSMKSIYQLRVFDKIPHVADLHEEVVIGTLKPMKIVKDAKKGTLVEWSIPVLEGYEERIISYKIKSKLSILGFFNLPVAFVKFKKNNRVKTVKSNKIKAALK